MLPFKQKPLTLFRTITQKKSLLILGGLLALSVLSFGLYALYRQEIKTQTLSQALSGAGKAGESVYASLTSKNTLSIEKTEADQEQKTTEALIITDNQAKGIQITFANQEESLKEENKPEEKSIRFPKNYTEPIEIKLSPEKTISILDQNAKYDYAQSTLMNEDESANDSDERLGLPHDARSSIPIDNYLTYTSPDERKTLYYAYQSDQALSEKQLKNWIVYRQGTGDEYEAYTFQNAKLKKNEDGSVGVFYFGEKDIQNQKTVSEVDSNLLERAQRVVTQDMQQDLLNNNLTPDLTIPRPYFIDRDGNKTDLDWEIDTQSNTIGLHVKAKPEQYPLALDPTLSFTAPGQSTTGDAITGEAGSGLGYSMSSGDFNTDGKTDLAVGAWSYSSNTGRVYIFYSDGSIPTTATTADITITGETTSNYFGYFLTTGDFNADGAVDLAVGAPGYSTNTGRAYIFHNDGSIPTTAATADVIITGGTTNNFFGISLTSGDFNADSKMDLAVGANLYSTNTGRAYIFHNDGSIPTTAATADVTITGGDTNNHFGYALASGDFNADGETDLAVGAYGYSGNTGRAYIFHNDGSIPTTAAAADVTITGAASTQFGAALTSGDFNADGRIDLAVAAYNYSSDTGRVYIFHNDSSIPTTAATADITITGETTSNYFGYFLTAGDFNTDGRTDLAVGAYGYSTNTGRAYIFYNDGSIPTTAGTADVIITGENASDSFGYFLSAGDFNADGKTDLSVGASGYSASTGRAYIFYSQNGQVNTNQSTTGEASSNFGAALVSGDFNSDGKTDLAVGAYGYSTNTGRVYIFYNSGSIPRGSTMAAAAANIIITGETTNNYFGASLASGDFNADGKTDLAVGAYGYSTNTGRAYIFYNDGSIPTTAATADVTITGETTNDSFGAFLISGDLDADGETDLAVGASGYSTNTGRVYIFHNDGSIPTTAATADTTITGNATNDSFGGSLTAGDFNADGETDLAVGASGYSTNTGRAYIFHNDGSIPTTAATADTTITGNATNDSFGGSLTAGDFNADGRTDLAVGASGYSTNTGRVYIFHNDGSIPTTAATADTTITGNATNDSFGAFLISGDLDADGETDLAVGASGYSTNTGRVYIFRNDGSIPTTAATADVTITGETTNNYFGSSLASGDFNADGKTDLAVGAYGYSTNAGRIYIYETRDDYVWQLQEIQRSDTIRTETTGGTGQEMKITGNAANNYFGSSLASGDFNADGRTDLAVGAYGYSTNTGRVYIFYNDGAIPTTSSAANVTITGETTSNYFGSSLASGDFNADSKTDLAVGAYGYSTNTGRVYIFHNDGSIPTTAATANVTITGETTNDSFGAFLISGDLDADGETDLAVGASGYSTNTGRAYIFYNDGSIPTTAATADVTITGNATNDSFGGSLTAGDFNADGKIDLAVGAYGYSTNTGRVYIFRNDGSIPTTAATADTTITGNATNDSFGTFLISGDLDADGETDLAVGASGYSTNTGRVYIFRNDGSIPTTAATADVTITGETTNDSFGAFLISGDLDADGETDLAVGASGYSTNTGRVYIFRNDGSIPTTAATADTTITGNATNDSFGGSLTAGDFNADGKTDLAIGAVGYSTNTGRVYMYTFNDTRMTGGATGDNFGYALASGDFNADGKTDLAVGAYGYSSDTGRAYIFYNDGSIPTTAATADVIITGETAGDSFGVALVSGDFNADGETDLAVGADGYSSSTGRAYIFHNDGAYPSTAGTADVTITGETTNNYFGYVLASGDLNADGETDLSVGAYGYSTNTGRAYIFHNDGSIPTTAATADVTITGEATGNKFGETMTSGDFNADSRIDLTVGASGYSTNTGRVYIFHNDGSVPTTAATADVMITGEDTNNYFGYAMTSGDFNADGKTDLAVGAYGHSSFTGRVYIFHNDGSYPSTAGSADVAIAGEAASNNFGYAMTSGDFNADGKTDLSVSATDYSSSTGRAYIFYNDGFIPTTADVTMTGETTSNYFGSSLVSGDFNADGTTDLAVGSYGYSTSTGRVYAFISEAEVVNETGNAVRGPVKFRGPVRMR